MRAAAPVMKPGMVCHQLLGDSSPIAPSRLAGHRTLQVSSAFGKRHHARICTAVATPPSSKDLAKEKRAVTCWQLMQWLFAKGDPASLTIGGAGLNFPGLCRTTCLALDSVRSAGNVAIRFRLNRFVSHVCIAASAYGTHRWSRHHGRTFGSLFPGACRWRIAERNGSGSGSD